MMIFESDGLDMIIDDLELITDNSLALLALTRWKCL